MVSTIIDKTKFMIATFTDLILRVVLAKALSIPFASTGIWLAWPIGWIIATAISVIMYITITMFKVY